MYFTLAPFIGVLITLMNAINSRFAAVAGGLPSVAVIHLVGLVGVCAILAAKRESSVPGRIPLHLYAGGFVGVGTVICCNVAYANLGASLAVALALLGQTVCSVVIDGTGFLGRKKYPFSLRTLPALAVIALGIVVIAGADFRNAAYAPVAVLSGVLPVITFSLNSRLGELIGVFRSTRMNYVVGLATTLAVMAATAAFDLLGGTSAAGFAAAAAAYPSVLAVAGPLLVLGGGLLGVVMVGAVNFVFPRIPALYATLLMFAGQAFAGVALDSATGGGLEIRKLTGAAIVLAGIGFNAYAERRSRAAA